MTARSAAVEIARLVALRCVHDATLGAAITASRVQTTFPRLIHWNSSSVAQGNAGIALLCAAMDAVSPGEGWDRHGHVHLTTAASATQSTPNGVSLFTGLAGIGLAALVLSAGRNRYQRLLTGVDAVIVEEVEQAAGRLTVGDGRAVAEFDAISGLSGVTAYLLRRRGSSREVDMALDKALFALAGLLADAARPPRWYTPAAWINDDERQHYPHGNLNCGLAHGLPGPLAVLALALLDDHDVQGGAEAVATASAWLAAHRADDEWGPNWSNAVPLGEDGSAQAPMWPSRAGWCYGAPGVARALWLAGTALGDTARRRLALEAIRAVVARPAEQRWLSSPTFCHGAAGLLQVLVRFARDTGAADLEAAAGQVCAEVVSAHEPESLLGYRNVEPGGIKVDHPGVLDGAPGVALALLSAGGDADPAWDRLFLLS